MARRHSENTNLVLHYENMWNGLPVQTHRGPLVVNYLESILATIQNATREYPRTAMMRLDLRMPAERPEADSAVISRFFRSLKAQVRADQQRKKRNGARVYPCRIRFIWAKEQDKSDHPHYHAAILVNRDAYFTLGKFQASDKDVDDDTPFMPPETRYAANMSERFTYAWASALGISPEQARGLVGFSRNSVYDMYANGPGYCRQLAEVFSRLSYLAKACTKHYGDRSRSFGYSRF